MLHKKQKALTKTHNTPSQTQRPKPHHLMNCERAVRPFRNSVGVGDFVPPHTKKLFAICDAQSVFILAIRTGLRGFAR